LVAVARPRGLDRRDVPDRLQVGLVSWVIAPGISLAASSAPSLVMAAVPSSQTAAANGLNSLMRSVGTSTCGTVIAAVLINGSRATGARMPHTSFQHAFIRAAAAAATALVVTLLLPRTSARNAARVHTDAPKAAATTSNPPVAA